MIMFFKAIDSKKIEELLPKIEKPASNMRNEHGLMDQPTEQASCDGRCYHTPDLSFTCCGGTDCCAISDDKNSIAQVNFAKRI